MSLREIRRPLPEVVRVLTPGEVLSGEGAATHAFSGDAASPSLGARLRPSLASDAPEKACAASPSLETFPGIHTDTSLRWFQASPSIQELRSCDLAVNRHSKPSETRTPSTTRMTVVADDHLRSAEVDQSRIRLEGSDGRDSHWCFKGQSGHRDVGNSPFGELLSCLRSKQPLALSAQGWGARREAPALASP